MMAEKKRFEEEARQKKIDQEMEQEFQHQAKMKLERRNEEEVVRSYYLYSCFHLTVKAITFNRREFFLK